LDPDRIIETTAVRMGGGGGCDTTGGCRGRAAGGAAAAAGDGHRPARGRRGPGRCPQPRTRPPFPHPHGPSSFASGESISHRSRILQENSVFCFVAMNPPTALQPTRRPPDLSIRGEFAILVIEGGRPHLPPPRKPPAPPPPWRGAVPPCRRCCCGALGNPQDGPSRWGSTPPSSPSPRPRPSPRAMLSGQRCTGPDK